MINRFAFLILLAGFVSFTGMPALAADISDEVTDLEEVTADSAAAKAEAKAASIRVEKERIENARELKSVREARQTAQAKKLEASEILKRSETELTKLGGEKAQLNKDVLKIGHDTMVADKMIGDAKARIEKTKADVATLLALKTAKQTALAEMTKQKMQLMRDSGAAEDDFALQQRELQKADDDEKAATAELEKTRAEEAVKKVAMETKIKELKEQIQASRLQRKAVDTDLKKYKNYNRRLEEQTKVGMSELNQMENPPVQANQVQENSK